MRIFRVNYHVGIACISHSSAQSEQEIREKVLDELCERCFKEIEKCEVAIRKYPSLQKSNTGSKLAFEVVIQWISELRSKQGEPAQQAELK